MIVFFSEKKAAALGLGKKLLAGASLLPVETLAKYTPKKEDFLYLDISGMEQEAIRKALGVLKRATLPWGIIDPKGNAADPAEFFFAGASDYLGPKVIKEGLKEKRLAAALAWKIPKGQKEQKEKAQKTGIGAEDEPAAGEGLPFLGGPRLPAGKFPPWPSVKVGTTAPFFFLFVSAEGGKGGLRGALGEVAFTSIRNRLRLLLQRRFEPLCALLWMETESNALLLIPPRASFIKEAVVSSLKILMAAPAIGLEILGLGFPVRFTFALHYGKTVYHGPGKTGTVVSEAVNFIFHLGTKRAEAGRLTVSGETPAEAIPEGLEDVFVKAGEFEGRPLVHSRRFFIRTD